MSERMTTERLEAIRKRAEAATEGPWLIEESRYGGQWNAGNPEHDFSACLSSKGDIEFIAAAREDIPALLTEVERLQERVSGINKNRNGWMSGLFRWQERAERLFRVMQRISEQRYDDDIESVREAAKEAVEREVLIDGTNRIDYRSLLELVSATVSDNVDCSECSKRLAEDWHIIAGAFVCNECAGGDAE